MKQMSFIPIDLHGEETQIKLCYAFVQSANYLYQELSVLNPDPRQFDAEHLFPRDLYLYTYHSECNQDLLPIDELVEMAKQKQAPIRCIGSHRPDMDRSIQLIWMPAVGGAESQLIVQILSSNMSSSEKMDIIEGLQKMARHIGADSHVI